MLRHRVLPLLALCAFAATSILIGRVIFTLVGRDATDSNALPAIQYPEVIEIAPSEHGSIAIGRFVMANSGSADLIVKDFRTSCSCAGVEIDQQGELRQLVQYRIKPGERAELLVRINVAASPGASQMVQIRFSTNDPEIPVGSIAVMIPRVLGGVFAEYSTVLLGELQQGADTNYKLRLYDNGIWMRGVSAIRSSHPERFEVTYHPAESGEVGDDRSGVGRLHGRVTIRPICNRLGRLDGHIVIEYAGENRAPDHIQVFGEVIGPVSSLPDTIVLPRYVNGSPQHTADVLLSNRDGDSILVEPMLAPAGVTFTVISDAADPSKAIVRINSIPSSSPRSASAVCQVSVRVRTQKHGVIVMSLPVIIVGDIR